MSRSRQRTGGNESGRRRPDVSRVNRGEALFTVGHSTRPFESLLAMLESFDIDVVADVRTIPRSRHNPQFEQAALGPALEAHRIRYLHLPSLGGLRHGLGKQSPNAAWRNASFRGYADYMQTDAFAEALEDLLALVRRRRVALMCAEAVPWRCHRSLIADALTVRRVPVEHIMGVGRAQPHALTPFARVAGRRVTYPLEAASP